MIDLSQAVAGFLVGTIVGLTGVGGGSLMTPVLMLFFHVPPVTAVGTDLLQAAVTKACGTLVHARARRIDWHIVAQLAAGSVPAAIAALVLVHRVPTLGSARIVTLTLGVTLLLTAAALLFSPRLLRAAEHVRRPGGARISITLATGAVLGVLVSISSVGAGALGITALYFLYPGLIAVRIVAVDIAHAVPLTLAAGVGHWLFGSVDLRLLASLLAGSLPGIYIGSHLAGRAPETLLRVLLAVTLVVVGCRLLCT